MLWQNRSLETLHKPLMPRATQKQVAWIVRNYPRYVIQRNDILASSPKVPEVHGKTNRIADPTGQTVARLEAVTRVIDAVESSIKLMDKGLRKALWDHCVLGKELPNIAGELTWKYYKNDFYYYVAIQLQLPIRQDISEADLLNYSHIPDECLKA